MTTRKMFTGTPMTTRSSVTPREVQNWESSIT